MSEQQQGIVPEKPQPIRNPPRPYPQEETSTLAELHSPVVQAVRKLPQLVDEVIGLLGAVRRYVESRTEGER